MADELGTPNSNPGIMDKLSSLLQNKLVQQFAFAVGDSVAKGQGIAPGANVVGQQNIEAQNMMKLMSRLLGPDGTKATISNAGINMTFPTKEASAMLQEADSGTTPNFGVPYVNPNPTLGAPVVTPVTPAPVVAAPAPIPAQGGRSVAPNPFDIGNIPASDLAGLTTQDISTALGMKMKLGEQGFDNTYKQALTNQAIAATTENTPSVDVAIPGGGTMKLTPKDYIAYRKIHEESQGPKAKEFMFAQSPAGGNFKGSFTEFLNAGDTVGMKDFAEAKRTGYTGKSYYDYKISMAKAGAVNLGTKVEEKKALSELGGQLYFNDPKWTEDIHKQTALFDKDQAWLVPEKDRPLAKSKVVVKTIEDKIAAGSGAIQSVTMDKDNKTMVWTVKWPSGDTKIIKQAVR